MKVGIEEIKKLREETGLSVIQCQKALNESEGDFEKARTALRKKGSLARDAKSSRKLGSGTVSSYIHNTGQVGAMVELLCETDFVSKNDEFVKLAEDIAMHTAAMNPRFSSKENVPEDELTQLKSELSEEIDKSFSNEKKEQILEGKVNARLKDTVLLLQPFIQDDKQTIQNLIESATQKFGERIEVGQIVVFKI